MQDWWFNAFTNDERNYIEKISGLSIQQEIKSTSQSASGFLWELATRFHKAQDTHIARKILDKAYRIAKAGKNIIDLHFTLLGIIHAYYPDRDIDSAALNKAVEACEEQINIATQTAKAFKRKYPSQSLPRHTGYEQLAILSEKQQQFDKAITLCLQAKRHGWAGEWDKRIARITKKKLHYNRV